MILRNALADVRNLTIPRATQGQTFVSLTHVRMALQARKEAQGDTFAAAMFQHPRYFPRLNWDGRYLWGDFVLSSR